MKLFDVIIIGAGAAGLMCAIEAGKRGKNVLLLDSSKNIGEKIRISGGGRCNFTNQTITADNFLSNNPHFCKSALKRFDQNDFINMVKKHNIEYHHKTLGQLFCDKSSKQIISMLVFECEENNVKITTEINVNSIKKESDKFIVKTNQENFTCESLVIATGGLSIPKMGATDFGYRIAKQFGLKITRTMPALVPFTLDEKILKETKELSGISAEAIVSLGKREFHENILFTHKGLSGPAILQISSYWKIGDKIIMNIAPKTDIFLWLETERKNSPKQDIASLISQILSKKLALYILNNLNISGNIADLNNDKIKKLAKHINAWEITPNGVEGYNKAEVTSGGIDTSEISSKTFESKKVSNLYFIGEVLDVTGHLGGYNFQWAWSSGYAAGQYV